MHVECCVLLCRTQHSSDINSCRNLRYILRYVIYLRCDMSLRDEIWNLYHIATEQSTVISHFAKSKYIARAKRVYRRKRLMMNDKTIKELAVELTVETTAICDNIKGRSVFVNQLLRSCSSIGANSHEAKYAQKYGYDSFQMINIYPLRATNFNNLPKSFNEELHRHNLIEIKKTIKNASAILCAWGTHIYGREYFKLCYNDILNIISMTTIPIYCLGVTKHGHPFHPLLRGIPVPEKLIDFDIKKYIV